MHAPELQKGAARTLPSVRSYVYWLAADDRVFGEGGDAKRIDALRALWREHHLVDVVSPFDGASFWIADGQPQARVIRTVHATGAYSMQVVDVDPARVLGSDASTRSNALGGHLVAASR